MLFGEYCFERENSLSSAANSVISASRFNPSAVSACCVFQGNTEKRAKITQKVVNPLFLKNRHKFSIWQAFVAKVQGVGAKGANLARRPLPGRVLLSRRSCSQ